MATRKSRARRPFIEKAQRHAENVGAVSEIVDHYAEISSTIRREITKWASICCTVYTAWSIRR